MKASGQLKHLGEAISGLVQLELDNAIYASGNDWLDFLTMTTGSNVDLRSELSEISGIEVLGAMSLTQESSIWYVLLLVEETEQFLLELIAMNGAVPHRIHIREKQLNATVSVRDWDHLKDFADEIESTYGSFELIGTTQVDALTYPLGVDRLKYIVKEKLTEDQLTTLETSFQMGYYTVPQTATSEDVAKQLGISQSTFSTKLRNAQYNLLAVLFGKSTDQ